MLRTLAITTMSLMMMACASGPSYTNSAGESAATANLKYNVGDIQIKMHSPEIKELPDQKGVEQLLTKKLNEKLAENNMKATGNTGAKLNVVMEYWRNLAGSAFNSKGEGTGIGAPGLAYSSTVTSASGEQIGSFYQKKGYLDLGFLGNISQMGDMFSGMDPSIEESHFEIMAENFVELLQNGN